MDLDLVNSNQLESSIGADFVSGINGLPLRPIKKGMLINYRNRNLPFYKNGVYKVKHYNVRGESIHETASSELVSQTQQPTISETVETATLTPVGSSLASETATSPVPSPANPSGNILLTPLGEPNIGASASTSSPTPTLTATPTPLSASTSVPTPTPTLTAIPSTSLGGYGGGYGGGSMPVEQGQETTEQGSKEEGVARGGEVSGEERVGIFKSFWFWGLFIGAGVGYFYAKSKKKDITKSTLLLSSIGGAVGYGAELVVRKKTGVGGKPSMKTTTVVK